MPEDRAHIQGLGGGQQTIIHRGIGDLRFYAWPAGFHQRGRGLNLYFPVVLWDWNTITFEQRQQCLDAVLLGFNHMDKGSDGTEDLNHFVIECPRMVHIVRSFGQIH